METKFYFVQINPLFKPPAFRHSNDCIFRNRTRKIGRAYHSHGLKPRKEFIVVKDCLRGHILGFLREKLGIFCQDSERGYYHIELAGVTYAAYIRTMEKKGFWCEVRMVYDDLNIANIFITPDLDYCDIKCSSPGRKKTMCLIATYLMHVLVTERAFLGLYGEAIVSF